MKRNFTPRALGEIAIRCNALEPMIDFYENVIGLERLSGNASGGIVFFRISDGFAGHTSVLALFDKSLGGRPGSNPTPADGPETGANSSLHHIALSLPYAEQDDVMKWYDHLGLSYRIETFGWVGWRGIFTEDPEGNTVELVAYDASLKD